MVNGLLSNLFRAVRRRVPGQVESFVIYVNCAAHRRPPKPPEAQTKRSFVKCKFCFQIRIAKHKVCKFKHTNAVIIVQEGLRPGQQRLPNLRRALDSARSPPIVDNAPNTATQHQHQIIQKNTKIKILQTNQTLSHINQTSTQNKHHFAHVGSIVAFVFVGACTLQLDMFLAMLVVVWWCTGGTFVGCWQYLPRIIWRNLCNRWRVMACAVHLVGQWQ